MTVKLARGRLKMEAISGSTKEGRRTRITSIKRAGYACLLAVPSALEIHLDGSLGVYLLLGLGDEGFFLMRFFLIASTLLNYKFVVLSRNTRVLSRSDRDGQPRRGGERALERSTKCVRPTNTSVAPAQPSRRPGDREEG